MTFTLFCRPLNHLSDSLIREKFSEFGNVVDVHIPRSFRTRRRQNFGYVKYDNKHAAARAIAALNGQNLNGQKMDVVWADEGPKSPDEMIEIKKRRHEERMRQRELEGEGEEEPRKPRRSTKDLPLHELFFTAVDYPPGIGEEFTPVYQRNLPPVGARRQFFSWVYVPEEVKERILREERERHRDIETNNV